jgi:hypothetical protein
VKNSNCAMGQLTTALLQGYYLLAEPMRLAEAVQSPLSAQASAVTQELQQAATKDKQVVSSQRPRGRIKAAMSTDRSPCARGPENHKHFAALPQRGQKGLKRSEPATSIHNARGLRAEDRLGSVAAPVPPRLLARVPICATVEPPPGPMLYTRSLILRWPPETLSCLAARLS